MPGRERLERGLIVRTLPRQGQERVRSLASGHVRFGPFAAGDWLIISVSVNIHIGAGGAEVLVTTGDALLPAGVHDFAIEAGHQYFDVLPEVAGAGSVTVWNAEEF